MVRGKAHGHGCSYTKGGDRFEGTWRNDMPLQGRMTFAAGHSFEGRFFEVEGKAGATQLEGVFLYETGRTMKFKGFSTVENGLTGEVLIKEADGTLVFEGRWKDNREDGEGTVVTDGNKYIGSFVQGRKHGKGKNIFSNGNIYEGEFVLGITFQSCSDSHVEVIISH